MKKILLIALFISTASFAQKTLHNYKYVIVPSKFDFVKSKDKYQTSSLTKFLFNKLGFTAFLDNEELPSELTDNRCKALTGTVFDDSGMFTTKSIVELKDCNNKVVFTSKEGKSKDKEYKKAYHEAIRDAFKSISYSYQPLSENTVVAKQEVVQEAEEVKEPEVVEEVVNATADATENPKKTLKNLENKTNVLYAQPTANGFQLVNTKPEVVFKVLKTSVKDVFVIKDKNGVLYKDGNTWVAEYYNQNKKVVSKYQVKF